MFLHSIFTTPFGEAAIIFRPTPFAIVGIELPRASRKALLALLRKQHYEKPGQHEAVAAVVGVLESYFKGNPIAPPWEWLSMGHFTPLQQSVLKACARIPYGQVRTYRELAEAVGRPRAYRFVGTTLAKNPFPLMIPCHRVVRSDGNPGRFGGGAEMKRKLIALGARQARPT